MSKVEKQQVPKIRFAGFLNSWEKNSLDSYVKVVSGGTPDTKIKEYWGGDIDWFAPAEIGSQRYVFSSERKITESGLKNSSAKLLPAHKTVLFTSRAGIGSMALLGVEACTNQGFQSLVVNTDKAETYFIYSMGKIITQSALKIASGSTFLEISGKALGSLQFHLPVLEEQTQIGNFFQQLDKLIELQTRAVESAETYKKAMLQKMFPQKGEKVPRMRFEGFSGDWEKSTLNEMARVFIGMVTTMTAHYVEIGVPLIRNSDIKANSINQSNLINLNPVFVEENSSRKLQKGDIVTVHTGDVGVSAVIPEELEGCVGFATLNTRIISNKKLESFYLACFFNTRRFLNWCLSVSTGDGRTNLNLKDFEKAEIVFPVIEEQRKIGNFFQKLDQNIESEKKKLEQYQTMKRAMLQRMFV